MRGWGEGCGGVFSSNVKPFSRSGHNNDSRHSAHYARSYSPHPMILANDDMVSNLHTYHLRVLGNHKTCHLKVLGNHKTCHLRVLLQIKSYICVRLHNKTTDYETDGYRKSST